MPFLGAIGNFYEKFYFYDKFVHFISGLLISWFIYLGLKKINAPKKYNIWDFVIYIISINTTIAVFWEIIEFIGDFIIQKNFQKSVSDTMLDMIASIAASIIISIILIYEYKKNPQKTKAYIK